MPKQVGNQNSKSLLLLLKLSANNVIFTFVLWSLVIKHFRRGKSGPALGGTEYRLMPSACRLIVRQPL